MAVKYLNDGQDFKDHPDSFREDFGFSGSRGKHHRMGAPERKAAGGQAESEPSTEHDGEPGYAAGGHHLHPHGHHIVKVEHHHDGTVVHHHEHGGMTMHHPDGHITHHDHAGEHLEHDARGGIEHMHDSSEYAHRARGGDGDEAQDKAMVKKGIHEHEDHEHHGEHTDLHLRGGGFAGSKPRIPRAMRPAAAKVKSPINTPPRDPARTTTPRNTFPGGAMGMGVEPSAEPDQAGMDEGIPQMSRGGKRR